jgi:hypothetical protein
MQEVGFFGSIFRFFCDVPDMGVGGQALSEARAQPVGQENGGALG